MDKLKSLNKEKLFNIGTWVAIIFLSATNYFSYLVTKQMFNMVFFLILLIFSVYILIKDMKKNGLALGAYIYVSIFYLFGLFSLIMSVRSFLIFDIRSLIICITMLIGDISLITYSIHKLSKPKNN